MSVEELRSNLQQIYLGLHDTTEPSPLVANWEGSCIYAIHEWRGRLWSWFYDFISFFNSADYRNENLRNAECRILNLFLQQQQQALDDRDDYFEALHEMLEEQVGGGKRLAVARHKLTLWHEATATFVSFYKQNQTHQKLKEFNLTAHALQNIADLSYFYRCIELEGLLQSPLPYLLLAKAACSQPLDYHENKKFTKFISKINIHENKLTCRRLDKTLHLLVEIFKQSTIFQNADLATLELACVDYGCRMFVRKEAKHLRWRESLKPGDRVSCEQHTFVLGKQLGRKEVGHEDQNLIFSVENDPSIILSIGINRVLHFLKRKLILNHGWALKTVKYLAIEEKGRFAVLQRLHDPIYMVNWKSTCDQIIPEDRVSLRPIAKLLRWLIEQEKTPINFSPEYMVFTEKGRIKSLKVMLEGPFDFNAIVQYIIGCANGNPWIYQYLIKKINSHRYAQFYLSIIKNATSNKPWPVADLVAVNKILPNTGILEQSIKLFEQIVLIREKCFTHLLGQFSALKKELILQLVNKAIVSCYQEGFYIGILPDDFSEQVEEHVIDLEIRGRF